MSAQPTSSVTSALMQDFRQGPLCDVACAQSGSLQEVVLCVILGLPSCTVPTSGTVPMSHGHFALVSVFEFGPSASYRTELQHTASSLICPLHGHVMLAASYSSCTKRSHATCSQRARPPSTPLCVPTCNLGRILAITTRNPVEWGCLLVVHCIHVSRSRKESLYHRNVAKTNSVVERCVVF